MDVRVGKCVKGSISVPEFVALPSLGQGKTTVHSLLGL